MRGGKVSRAEHAGKQKLPLVTAALLAACQCPKCLSPAETTSSFLFQCMLNQFGANSGLNTLQVPRKTVLERAAALQDWRAQLPPDFCNFTQNATTYTAHTAQGHCCEIKAAVFSSTHCIQNVMLFLTLNMYMAAVSQCKQHTYSSNNEKLGSSVTEQ